MREFAAAHGASTIYIPSRPLGGFDVEAAKVRISFSFLLHLLTNISCKDLLTGTSPLQNDRNSSRWLFVLTGQSNVSNHKPPLSICSDASSLGYDVVVDAAALAATSRITLANSCIDAMAISFYKMFGYPTGVGALIAKKSFLRRLKRPWFAGGTVDIVQVPGQLFTRSDTLHEQFEVGIVPLLFLQCIRVYVIKKPNRMGQSIIYNFLQSPRACDY